MNRIRDFTLTDRVRDPVLDWKIADGCEVESIRVVPFLLEQYGGGMCSMYTSDIHLRYIRFAYYR